jgi:branched-chain amino acid aminotransferase
LAYDARREEHLGVSLWQLDQTGVHRTATSSPSLDELSLTLPEGAYTTMRTYGGRRVVDLTGHLQRLSDSLTLVGARRHLDPVALRQTIAAVIDGEGQPDVRLRITVPAVGEQVLIACEPWQSHSPELYGQGVRCATIELVREQPRAKTTAFIAPSRAAKARADPAVHELIRRDAEGHLLEGITSNFFAVLGGTLRTAEAGVLAGVTCGVVLALARDLVIVVREPITMADLPALGEAFITSSTREVVPVVEIDGVAIGDGCPGPLARELLARYRAHLDRLAEMP